LSDTQIHTPIIRAGQYTKIRGARIAASQSPPRASGPVSVQRKVPKDGVVMVARQRLRVGRTYSGKIVYWQGLAARYESAAPWSLAQLTSALQISCPVVSVPGAVALDGRRRTLWLG
jgi:hypothetical protein